MKLSKYLIDIDLKCESGEHLLVNGRNGLVDVIDGPQYAVLQSWLSLPQITLHQKEQNNSLYDNMIKRGYLVENDYDEEASRDKLIQEILHKTQQKMKYCDSACFVLTYNCNFSCPYCYEKSIESVKRMTTDQVNQIFNINGNNLKHISFFGGEPLLPANREIIQYIISKAPKAKYSLITNGYYLKEYFDVLSVLNISNIQVTLDGDRDSHDKTRLLKKGEGTFDKIMSGIQFYAEQGIPVTIRMNITPENRNSCFTLKKRIGQLQWSRKVKFEMQPVFQTDDAKKNELNQFMLEEDICSQQKNTMLLRQSPLINFLYSGVPMRPVIKVCNSDTSTRFYDPEGDVYSCILAVGNKKKRVAVYGKELVYETESMLNRSIASIPKCKKCKYALLCGAGCPNAIPENRCMMETPNCGSFMNEIENIVPQIYKLKYKKNEKNIANC